MDLFGTKAAKKVEQLSVALVEQSERYLSELTQVKQAQEDLQLKASRDILANSFTNFNTQIFPHYNVIKEQLIFQTMDDIYSVVSRLATTAAMIPIVGEGKDKEPLKPTDRLMLFLDTLSFEEKEKLYTCLILMGEVFAYKEVVDFGVNAGLQRIKYLNPANMVVIISDRFPTEIVGYRYYDSYNGFSKDFTLDEIFYIRTFNPTTDIQKMFRGLGLGTILKQRLTRVQAELDVSIAQMQNGGMPGVMFEKQPLEVGALGKRQDNFARFLANSSNKGAPYMLNGDVGYLAIGSTLADMNVAQLADIDFDKICNACSVSSVLFNNKKASTESNVKEMRKDMFTNATIPIVKRFVDGLNIQALPFIRTTGKFCYDITGISELREDLKAKAEAYAAAPMMQPNEVVVGLGGKKSDDPLMDKWYMKSGYTAIDDMALPPIDANAAGDYTAPAASSVTPATPAK